MNKTPPISQLFIRHFKRRFREILFAVVLTSVALGFLFGSNLHSLPKAPLAMTDEPNELH